MIGFVDHDIYDFVSWISNDNEDCAVAAGAHCLYCTWTDDSSFIGDWLDFNIDFKLRICL